jgi:hypothetical protein
MRAWHVVTFVLVALVLGTSFAHVLQWPAKLQHDGPVYTRLHDAGRESSPPGHPQRSQRANI